MERQRGGTPPVYNARRAVEQPIPVLVPKPSNDNAAQGNNECLAIQSPNDSFGDQSDANGNAGGECLAIEWPNDDSAGARNDARGNGGGECLAIQSPNNFTGDQDDDNGNEGGECLAVHSPNNNPYDPNRGDEYELDEALIDDPSVADHRLCIDPLAIKTEDPFVAINSTVDADMTDELTDCFCEETDGMTIYYDDISSFKPILSEYQIKRNDTFSGTLPYKEYVSEELISVAMKW